MSNQLISTLCLSLLLLISHNSFGARFANQFVEFELPPKWQCNLEQTEWICQSSETQKRKDAIIILAAKLRGEQDSLDQYLAYLKQTKTYNSVKGTEVKSDPKYSKTVKINEHAWIDALHLESEIPGFYTRYLATVKEDIAVLVTYSINKNKYQEYLNDFESLAKTLKVFRKPGGLNLNDQSSLFNQAKLPKEFQSITVFPEVIQGADPNDSSQKTSQSDDTWLYLLILVGAVGFILWRKKKKS